MEASNLFYKNKLAMAVTSMSDTDLQASPNVVVFFVLFGNVELFHNGKSVHLAAGNIYIINHHDLYGFIANGDNNILVTTLQIDNRYYVDSPLSPFYIEEGYNKISQTLSAIFLELEVGSPGYEEIIEGYFYRLLGLFKRYLPEDDSKKGLQLNGKLSAKNSEILDYLNENYKESITLDLLSETFFVSKFYLAHSFKNQVGLTIGNYLKEIRLIHSQLLVEKSVKSLAEISEQTGFTNLRSFSESFRNKFGVTPTVYREKLMSRELLIQKELIDLGAFDKLNQYAGVEGYDQLDKDQVSLIEVKIPSHEVKGKLVKNNVFVRLKDVSSNEKLKKIKALNVTKYVSVTHLFQLVKLKQEHGKLTYNSRELIQVLREIHRENLLPFIQISFLDFDDFMDNQGEEKEFIDLMSQLSFDLKREFSDTKEWCIEFRCFYELENSGALCQPIKECIPLFKGIGKTLVHLPVQPNIELKEVNEEVEDSLYIIDDMARARKYSYQEVLEILSEPKFIAIISENKNMVFQEEIVKRMEKLETDFYYQNFSGLVFASQMLWLFMYSVNRRLLTFEPLSLDGMPLFTYFPEELSNRIAVLSEDNIRRDTWYAYQFRHRLFEDIVFKNEFCVVTKQDDNYRVLAFYPDKESLDFLYEKHLDFQQEPTMILRLRFEEMKGTYQIVEQKMTPDIKNQINDFLGVKDGQKLSFEITEYIDEMSQPKKTLKELETKDLFSVEIKLPIYGISYTELNRIK